MPEYVYPTSITTVLYGGGRVRLHPNQQWLADDPFVKARPGFFGENPQEVAHSAGFSPVERATRAPGEVRAARQRAPKASTVKDAKADTE